MKQSNILSLRRVLTIIAVLMTCVVGFQEDANGQLLRRNRCSGWQANRCRTPLIQINRGRNCAPACCSNCVTSSPRCNTCVTCCTVVCETTTAIVQYCPTSQLYMIGDNFVHEVKNRCSFNPRIEIFDDWMETGCKFGMGPCNCDCMPSENSIAPISQADSVMFPSGIATVDVEYGGDASQEQLYVRENDTATSGYRVICHKIGTTCVWTALPATVPGTPGAEQYIANSFTADSLPSGNGYPRGDKINFTFDKNGSNITVSATRIE